MVHLPLLVGKLARAEARRFVHHQRGHHLRVARFRVAVEEEGDEGSLQSCSLSLIDGESGSRELHAQLEIDNAVFARQFPVWKRPFGQCLGQRRDFDHFVLFGAPARRYDFGRYVGQGNDERVHAVGGLAELLFECFRLLLQERYSSLGRVGLFASSRGKELSYLFGEGVLFGKAAVQPLLERTAQVVLRYDFFNHRGRIDSLDGEALHGALPLFPDLFQSKHTQSVLIGQN